MEKRGQVSVEQLMMTGLGMVIIVGVIFVVINQISVDSSKVNKAELEKYGNSLIDTVNRLSYMGGPSTLTTSGNFPSGIVNVTVENNKTLIFWYRDGSAKFPVAFRSPIDIAVDFPNYASGKRDIIVTSKDGYTLICSPRDKYGCDGICNITQGERSAITPSDCCTGACNACTGNGRSTYCAHDATCHPECYGHNGCQQIC